MEKDAQLKVKDAQLKKNGQTNLSQTIELDSKDRKILEQNDLLASKSQALAIKNKQLAEMDIKIKVLEKGGSDSKALREEILRNEELKKVIT